MGGFRGLEVHLRVGLSDLRFGQEAAGVVEALLQFGNLHLEVVYSRLPEVLFGVVHQWLGPGVVQLGGDALGLVPCHGGGQSHEGLCRHGVVMQASRKSAWARIAVVAWQLSPIHCCNCAHVLVKDNDPWRTPWMMASRCGTVLMLAGDTLLVQIDLTAPVTRP